MNRLSLSYALAQLSDRERILLFLLAIVMVPVAVVFLAILPLMEARENALNDAAETRSLLNWVSAQVTEMPEDAGAGNNDDNSAASTIGLSGVEDSLVQYDLRDLVSQLANRNDGGIDLALEQAPFEMLSLWLKDMAPVWGYRMAAFRIEAVSPGKVNARFELGVDP